MMAIVERVAPSGSTRFSPCAALHQARPASMAFSRAAYIRGVQFPSERMLCPARRFAVF
jgi:hypothetical protein